jgi:ABC-type dipeptide/oligopeptide/nickel transport system permease component
VTRYIIRRLLQMVLVFFGATFLLFAALYLLPGDPTQALGSDRTLAPATVQAIRARYHLDDPIYVQYSTYIRDILRGDLGTSIQLRRPVSQLMRESIPWSLKLALSATVVEIILGIGSGVISAIKRYSFLDTLSTVSTSVLIAIPVFWLGLMLQILFGLKFRGTFLGLPISGVTDGWKSYVLPSITLASAFAAVTARLTRTTMLEVMRQDYVRTAAAKGLSRRSVVFKHALRNAMIPVVTNIGVDFGTLIGGAILTETVFAWPGVGRQVYFAIIAHDNPVIIGSTIVFVFAFMIVNLIVDISYAVLDPRIRYV